MINTVAPTNYVFLGVVSFYNGFHRYLKSSSSHGDRPFTILTIE
ncbi:hypothetical protein LEP1GSC172_0764 [Leptospira noguchii]|uniref:Uncharacterized protein n=2 Tax=Leptospira noguchii TaxID=28182 RepID=T0GTM7_9LEPT|nr:hypothetical protein LEP1GSC172_0764 [Leptospira noguchii]EQA70701.1 hypothetical protein LEP1GSC059_4572 [Leptospira noguchii serovar Panama str. CZ214]